MFTTRTISLHHSRNETLFRFEIACFFKSARQDSVIISYTVHVLMTRHSFRWIFMSQKTFKGNHFCLLRCFPKEHNYLSWRAFCVSRRKLPLSWKIFCASRWKFNVEYSTLYVGYEEPNDSHWTEPSHDRWWSFDTRAKSWKRATAENNV